MSEENKKIIRQEVRKVENLIESAQQQLDSAKQNKAPQSTVKHLEARIEALEERKQRCETALKNETQGKSEGHDDSKTTAPSGKKGDKKEKIER